MFIEGLILSAAIALLATAAFSVAARRRGRGNGLLGYFLIVMAATWAGGIWLKPAHGEWESYFWLPFAAVGAVFLALLMYHTPRRPPRGRQETLEKLEEIAREKTFERFTYIVLSIFFWLVLGLLSAVIVVRYVFV